MRNPSPSRPETRPGPPVRAPVPEPRATVRILVTGATGVIGRRVVPLLAARHYLVTAAGRSLERLASLEENRVRPLRLDLFDRESVQRAVTGHSVVINLATHVPSSSVRALLPGAWRENDRLRRDASRRLVAAALAGGAQRFIQESFAPIYEDAGQEWIGEAHPVSPAPYNRSVLDAERAALRFAAAGHAGIVLRFAMFYGPDSYFTRDLITWVRKGWAPVLGPPEGYISSVSHDDAAAAVVAALDLPPGAYNVTDDEPVTRRDYVDSLAAAIGVPPPRLPPPWVARLAGSTGELLSRSLRISNRKLREASDWRPVYAGVREGWRAVVANTPPQPARRLPPCPPAERPPI